MPRIRSDRYQDSFKEIVVALLVKRGKSLTVCEQCGDEIPEGKFAIHHTRYEGATINDLQIVDAKCNLKSENKGLI